MDNFKFGLFDVFVYALPGFISMLSIIMLFQDLSASVELTVAALTEKLRGVHINTRFIGFVFSYIIGFSLHPFGFTYFNLVGKNIWKKRLVGQAMPLSALATEAILIRHYSKGNLAFLEVSNALRAMSFNLSLAFIGVTVVIISNATCQGVMNLEWTIVSLSCVGVALVTLKSAVHFHQWSVTTPQRTVEVLRLNDPQKRGKEEGDE